MLPQNVDLDSFFGPVDADMVTFVQILRVRALDLHDQFFVTDHEP